MDYESQGEPWQVTRAADLARELRQPESALAALLPRLHAALADRPRLWEIARRLYGFRPLVPPAGSDPEDFEVWAPDFLCSRLVITRTELRTQLEALAGVAQGLMDAVDPPAELPRPEPASADPLFADPQQRLDLDDAALFTRYGATPPAASEDRSWLAQALRDWRKLLDHSQTRELALQTLFTAVESRKIQRALNQLEPTDKEYASLINRKVAMEERYQTQLQGLDKIAGWFGVMNSKESLQNSISVICEAQQEYYSTGGRRLVDGIFTLTEIEVELLTSKQQPDPGYRAGYVAFLNAARTHLFDPHWDGSEYKPTFLRRVDRAFAATYKDLAQHDAIPVPDLLDMGPAGEYPEQRKTEEGGSEK